MFTCASIDASLFPHGRGGGGEAREHDTEDGEREESAEGEQRGKATLK